MSRPPPAPPAPPPPPSTRPSTIPPSRRTRTLTSSATRTLARRPSFSGLARAATTLGAVSGGPKAQRTSKTTQKLVLLPTAPQTRPLPQVDDGARTDREGEDPDRWLHGYETDGGVRDTKSVGERMTKAQREAAGYSRLTAYCVAKGLKMKLLASFLKREHNVKPRIFDEAMYVVRSRPILSASVHSRFDSMTFYTWMFAS